MSGKSTIPIEQRFWSKVNKDGPVPPHRPELGPCWVWTAGHFDAGYGSFWANGKDVGAHVFAYRLTNGNIPKGYHLDHLCRNKPCVNPKHLEAVTPRINTLRSKAPTAVNAAKTHCVNGHKFTPENTLVRKRKNGGRACAAYRQRPEVIAYHAAYFKARKAGRKPATMKEFMKGYVKCQS